MLAVTMLLKGVLTKMPSPCVRTIMSVPLLKMLPIPAIRSGVPQRGIPMLEMV